MPPFSVGVAQIEHRLGIVRRRLNLLTLQDAVYWSGSLVALATALLIAVALRGRATLFAVAVWASVGAIAAAITAAVLRLRRRWQSVEQVVRWADRQAALEDRLATLLLDPLHTGTSRFKDLLLEQVLAAAPRWDVDTLAPRRVPRSLYALLMALAALVVTSFFVRPPLAPQSAAAAPPAHPQLSETTSGVPQQRSVSERVDNAALAGVAGKQGAGLNALGNQSGQPMSAPTGRQNGDQLPAAGQPGEHGRAQLGGHEAGAQGESQRQTEPPAGGSAATAETMPEGMAEKLQDAIRQALGAPASEAGRAGSVGGRRDQDSQATSSATAGKPSERDATHSARQEEGATNSKPSGSSGSMPGTGAAANSGNLAGQTTAELFSAQAGVRVGGRESQRLAIKLGALTAMAPNQLEPQRQSPPVGELPVSAPRNAPPALSDEQIPDAPLQKADVAPEHETLVRRVFTRE